MRIFISHPFKNVNKRELREKIETISLALEKREFETFNYFRDKENWEVKEFPPGVAIKEAFEELKKCDTLLIFIDKNVKSEGIFLEAGFAKALKKKIILLISEKASFPTLEAISEIVIKFRNLKEVSNKLAKVKI